MMTGPLARPDRLTELLAERNIYRVANFEGKMGNFKFARARLLNSRGAEHAVRAKHVDGIKTLKSRAGIPIKACLRGRVKRLRGGNKCASGPP